MNYSSLSQLALLIIAIAVVFTYIKPSFVEIKDIQDTTLEYTEVYQKTSEFNSKLSGLVASAQAFRASDLEALDVFLPATVDELTVMSDIKAIADQSGVTITLLNASDVVQPSTDVEYTDVEMEQASVLAYQDFNVTLSGSYDSLKTFLGFIAQNNYTLEVVSLVFGVTSEDVGASQTSVTAAQGEYQMILRAYSYTSNVIIDMNFSSV